jgi:hypothetical protein
VSLQEHMFARLLDCVILKELAIPPFQISVAVLQARTARRPVEM